MRTFVRKLTRSFGFELSRVRDQSPFEQQYPDISVADRQIVERVSPFTMTSVERQLALIQSIRYVVARRIEGCIVECGVWRGGSSMASALTLLQERDVQRHLYLFDTFEGMTPPTAMDKTPDGTLAQTHLKRDTEKTNMWCIADLNDVTQNLISTGYPQDKIHFIKGPVETTIPQQAPTEQIALLRLDTDWYESTRHELNHLFDRLQPGGVLIIDDYGHWEGARKAFDEYFAKHPQKYLLNRIDYTGRLLIKA